MQMALMNVWAQRFVPGRCGSAWVPRLRYDRQAYASRPSNAFPGTAPMIRLTSALILYFMLVTLLARPIDNLVRPGSDVLKLLLIFGLPFLIVRLLFYREKRLPLPRPSPSRRSRSSNWRKPAWRNPRCNGSCR